MHTSSLVGLLTAYCYATMVIVVLVAAAGAPIPVGALFIGLGALSLQPHGPNFLALALLCTAAAVSGDILDYGLGRVGRPVLYARLLRPFLKFSGIGIDDATKGLGRSSRMMIFLTRFTLTPLASPLSILAGVVHMPLARFLAWDAPGEAVDVVGNLALGRWLGSGLTTHSPHAGAFWGTLAFASVAPTLLFLVVPWHRATRRSRARQVAASHVGATSFTSLHPAPQTRKKKSANAAATSSVAAGHIGRYAAPHGSASSAH